MSSPNVVEVEGTWNYKTYYPKDSLNTFSVGGRLNDIFNGHNMHGHYNNASVHKGFGNLIAPTSDSWQDRAVKDGRAVRQLPHRAMHGSPYDEFVWNLPGMEAGVTRVVVNRHNRDEIYFTDDHYTVYWLVWGANNTHKIFT